MADRILTRRFPDTKYARNKQNTKQAKGEVLSLFSEESDEFPKWSEQDIRGHPERAQFVGTNPYPFASGAVASPLATVALCERFTSWILPGRGRICEHVCGCRTVYVPLDGCLFFAFVLLAAIWLLAKQHNLCLLSDTPQLSPRLSIIRLYFLTSSAVCWGIVTYIAVCPILD